MILSYFIHNSEIHLFSDNIQGKICATRQGAISDILVNEIRNYIGNYPVKRVLYQMGPGSFTTLRIVNAIAKGLLISDKSIDFVGVSSYLTYRSLQRGDNVYIPTMRGDFFKATFQGNYIVSTDIETKHAEISINTHQNLAEIQFNKFKSGVYEYDNKHLTRGISIDYGFKPEYSAKNSAK